MGLSPIWDLTHGPSARYKVPMSFDSQSPKVEVQVQVQVQGQRHIGPIGLMFLVQVKTEN